MTKNRFINYPFSQLVLLHNTMIQIHQKEITPQRPKEPMQGIFHQTKLPNKHIEQWLFPFAYLFEKILSSYLSAFSTDFDSLLNKG